MRKSELHFERIPVQQVKRKVNDIVISRPLNPDPGLQIQSRSKSILHCNICRRPVPVETAKADGYGQAIHEECYILSVTQKSIASRMRRAQPSS